MPVSAETYKRVALEDDESRWELVCGELRKKPPMTSAHDFTGGRIGFDLMAHLDEGTYDVRVDRARLRVSTGSFRVPDVTVVPMADVLRRLRETPRELDVQEGPVPLVVEVWSPSTGDYDFEVKLAQYRERGDAEIWYVQPYDRHVTIWRRQPDGSYVESHQASGVLSAASLPGMTVDLDRIITW